MTNEELQALIARNAEAIASNTEGLASLKVTVENQGRNTIEGLASLQASAESQARSIESMRENMSFNTQTIASAVELAASSQRTAAASMETAAAAMELSASTFRAIDRSEKNITRLEQMLDITIKDNQADRARITRLED
jgi:hypothetical protein